MAERNIAHLVITRGARSTLSLGSSGSVTEVPAQRVKPLDTVGAGDAFAGCFAAGIARGESIDTAINHANCAGALATLKVGAQDAIPTRRQISSYLKRKSQ